MGGRLVLWLLPALLGTLTSLPAVTAQTKLASEILCEGKNVELAEKADLLLLEFQLKKVTPNSECPPHVRSAVYELAELLNEPDTGLCSMERAQRIKSFYLKYLDTSKDRLKEGDTKAKSSFWSRSKVPKLPKSLRNFAIAYGLQVGEICKSLMYNVLVERKDLMPDEDYERFGAILKDGSPMAEIVSSLSKPGDVVLPSDFASLMKTDKSAPLEKIYIQSASTKTFARLKRVCEMRFQPVYEQLILPHATMSSAGFDDESLGSTLMIKRYWPQLEKWTRLVFLCEGLRMLEPIEYLEEPLSEDEPSNPDFAESAPRTSTESPEVEEPKPKPKARTFRILTKEEAEEVERKLGEREVGLQGEDDTLQLEKVEFDMNDFTQTLRLRHTIFDPNDGRLAKNIRRVKTHKTEARRLRAKLMSRALDLLKQSLFEGRLKLIATAPVKALWKRLSHKKSEDDGDVNSLVAEQIERLANNAQILASEKTDQEKADDIKGAILIAMTALIFSALVSGIILGVVALIGVIVTGSSAGFFG